jgi:hypothetical protein
VTTLFFLGAEQPTNARLLGEAGASHIGLSYHSLLPRLPKKKAYTIRERMPVGTSVYLASGGHSFKGDDLESFTASYESFVEANRADLHLVTDVDRDEVPEAHRAYMHTVMGDRFAPVWRESQGIRSLDAMAERYSTISVRADSVRNSPALSAKLRPLSARYGVSWHLVDGARMEDLMSGRFDSAATVAWLSPMKYGELIVWDGARLQRYPKRMRDTSLQRHKTAFSRAGFDADAILEGDHNELTRYTVWAFQQMESRVDRKKPPVNPFSLVQDPTEPREDEEISTTPLEHPPAVVDNSGLVVRNEPGLPTPRTEGLQVMPGFGFKSKTEIEIDADGHQIVIDRPIMEKGAVSLRACDSCHVQANCPAFKAGAECAYKLPIELKTKAQQSAAMMAILERQYERVAFMQMQEELNGGYADPNTSLEIDRLLKMQQTIKEILDERDYVRLQVEGKAQSGVLSALFGSRAKSLGDLEQPMATEIIEHRMLEQ